MAQRTNYKWTIHNFSTVASRENRTSTLESKRFTLTGSNIKFHLEFEPTNLTEDHCALGLGLDDLGEAKSVELVYKVWIENTNGNKIGMYTDTFYKSQIGGSVFSLLHHDNLYSPASNFIKHDILFICCEIRYKSSIPSDDTPEFAAKIAEKEWLFYQEGFTGPCIIEVGDQKFEIDKKKLMAHSPVFDRMFKSGMKEAQTGKVTLSDTTPIIIQALVKYLHVHYIEDLDEEALGLYFLADKYEITDLKDKCSRVLIGELNEGNILDRLIMAFRHSDKAFKEGVLDYLADRPGSFKEIMKSDEWRTFINDNMQLSREMIDEAFKSMNWY